jgi:hypothetical protein
MLKLTLVTSSTFSDLMADAIWLCFSAGGAAVADVAALPVVLLSVPAEPGLLSAVGFAPFAVPAGELSEEDFAPPVEVLSMDDFDLLSLFISPEVWVEDFLSAAGAVLSCACCVMALLPPLSSTVEPDFGAISLACEPGDSRDIEGEVAAPPLSPFMPCASARPVTANNAAAATETRKLFLMEFSSCVVPCGLVPAVKCPRGNASKGPEFHFGLGELRRSQKRIWKDVRNSIA